ncbi:putative C-terminal domain small phosphatase [Tritrichomonas foetus]|uniref:C-terminal domain small phosphatase n=1 Tax=Tritrichomonas foetus TaxID=1144522 RepID=A0A1J4KLA3_9EUKA|nr:putative C-terminal domain small phosphatase [Tritrichomonas foetus]|eukprot:OHT11914.1 putative C-terminal domain small phosphatase [Tritrichomonas foetus]
MSLSDRDSLLPNHQQGIIPTKMETDILHVMKESYVPHSYINSQYPEKSVPSTSIDSVSSPKKIQASNSNEGFTIASYSSTSYIAEDDYDFVGQQNRHCCSCILNPIEQKPSNSTESELSYSSGDNNLTSILLGPPDAEDVHKFCLVVDLDETLVHSSFVPIEKFDFSFPYFLDSTPTTVYASFRPNAIEFVKTLAPLYEMVFFTASCKDYADPIIDELDSGRLVKHRLYRESCTELGGNFVKDLSRLNRDLDRIIIIDNCPTAYMLQPGNAISVQSWFEDQKDKELSVIMQFLSHNVNAKDIYELFGHD